MTACPAGMVHIATANAPMVLGIRHVTKLATALTMVHVIPRVANASVNVVGLGLIAIRLAQVVFMAMDVNTSKSLTLNIMTSSFFFYIQFFLWFGTCNAFINS